MVDTQMYMLDSGVDGDQGIALRLRLFSMENF